MSKVTLKDITSGYDLSGINSNFQKLEEELNDKVMYRDNPIGEPNHSNNDIDLNSNDLLNVNEINVTTLKINGEYVTAGDLAIAVTDAVTEESVDTFEDMLAMDFLGVKSTIKTITYHKDLGGSEVGENNNIYLRTGVVDTDLASTGSAGDDVVYADDGSQLVKAGIDYTAYLAPNYNEAEYYSVGTSSNPLPHGTDYQKLITYAWLSENLGYGKYGTGFHEGIPVYNDYDVNHLAMGAFTTYTGGHGSKSIKTGSTNTSGGSLLTVNSSGEVWVYRTTGWSEEAFEGTWYRVGDTSVAEHEAGEDPHPQYLRPEELPSTTVVWFTDNESLLDSNYYNVTYDRSTEAESSFSATCTAVSTPVLIGQWMRTEAFSEDVTVGDTNTRYTLDMVADTDNVTVYVEAYLIHEGGGETPLGVSEEVTVGTTRANYVLNKDIIGGASAVAGDIVATRIYAYKTSTGLNPTVTLYMEGDTPTRAITISDAVADSVDLSGYLRNTTDTFTGTVTYNNSDDEAIAAWSGVYDTSEIKVFPSIGGIAYKVDGNFFVHVGEHYDAMAAYYSPESNVDNITLTCDGDIYFTTNAVSTSAMKQMKLRANGELYTPGPIYEGSARVYSAANNNIGTGSTNYAAGDHVAHQGNLDLNGYYLYDSTGETVIQDSVRIQSSHTYSPNVVTMDPQGYNSNYINFLAGSGNQALKIGVNAGAAPFIYGSSDSTPDANVLSIYPTISSNGRILAQQGVDSPVDYITASSYTITSSDFGRFLIFANSGVTITIDSDVILTLGDHYTREVQFMTPAGTPTIVNSSGQSLYYVSSTDGSFIITTGSTISNADTKTTNRLILTSKSSYRNFLISQ